MLFGLMDWDAEAQYKFTGRFITNGEDKLLVFELDEPVITKTEEQVVVPETADDQPDAVEEEIVIREKVQIYPESWQTTFGKKINVLNLCTKIRINDNISKCDILVEAIISKERDTKCQERNEHGTKERVSTLWAEETAEVLSSRKARITSSF